ncbi:VOC family protein [Nocardiopsis sp. CNR-923]|uniref:VOC family protein n=1 Tax=Nocardiopsis sp. CNR-923 TaxID=1904965 RepID=UPI0021CCE96B|nr:hypothetical protein [Nocardiopsis sp. CNR-923]
MESVDDVRANEARLLDAAVEFAHDGVVPHGEGVSSGGAFFHDPDGIRLEISAPTGVEDAEAPMPAAPTCGFFSTLDSSRTRGARRRARRAGTSRCPPTTGESGRSSAAAVCPRRTTRTGPSGRSSSRWRRSSPPRAGPRSAVEPECSRANPPVAVARSRWAPGGDPARGPRRRA